MNTAIQEALQKNTTAEAVRAYCASHGLSRWCPRAALIDMDGVLYDSMPGHARAWKRMMDEAGIECTEEEFFLYEGMTGRATIEMLAKERLGYVPEEDIITAMYARKSEYFKQQGPRKPMPGADRMIRTLQANGLTRVLVTGSAQRSLLESLARDYPGGFEADMRVTALDVNHGKPDPEPYLRGLKIANTKPTETIVIENAPLGVRSGHDSGCFTIGITTGPVPSESLYEEGADIVFGSMADFADALEGLIECNQG